MSVSEQIDQFIAENGGNTRDALNVALARLDLAQREIQSLKDEKEVIRKEYAAIINRAYSHSDSDVDIFPLDRYDVEF